MTIEFSGTEGASLTGVNSVPTTSIVDLAVTGAKITDATITPNKLSGLTITTSQTTPLPGVATVMSYTHGLGVAPASAELELVCLTADMGYSVGDIITGAGSANAANEYLPISVKKNTTAISSISGSLIAFIFAHGSTATGTTPTAANWAWRFKIRTA